MQTKYLLTVVFFAFLLSLSWTPCDSQSAQGGNLQQEEMEKYLKTAKILPNWKKVGRRTESYIVKLDDGNIQRGGFLRFTDRQRPITPPDSYKYCLAAYELDKLLDLNLTPATVERVVQDRQCSLQLLIEDIIDESNRRVKKLDPPDPESFSKIMDDLNIFEHFTYSSALCGHKGSLEDILIEHKKDWKVWRVDFSTAFADSQNLIPDCEIKRCSKKLFQNLVDLKDKTIKTKLKRFLNKEEIGALLERKKVIIEKLQQLIKEKGEEAVLF